MWQDWVFSIGSWLFALALIPSVFSKNKPSIFSSALTGLVLLVFAFTYLSLSLNVTFVSTLVTASLWAILFVQKFIERRKQN